MDFALSPAAEALRARVRDLVEAEIIPLEADPTAWDAHENIALDRLDALRARVKAEGLWLPQLGPEHGGLGVDHVTQAALYEEMNRGLFGPAAFNCAAPDDGTMMLLAKIATPAQQARWLAPLASGAVRSAFAMTEPAPGAGSDPVDDAHHRHPPRRRLAHRRAASGSSPAPASAQHFVLIARTSDDPRKGLTAFLFDRDQPGWRIDRRIPIMGPEEHGGHCELVFDGLEIPDENRLMGVGDGLKVTQIRLGPARLTHCMRWLGLARRSLEIARAYVEDALQLRRPPRRPRERAGQARRGRARDPPGPPAVMHAAWKLDQGDRARAEISMAKVVVSEALHQAADTAIQLCGARGYSRDTPLEWIYRYARQARLVDGASEVHRMVLARELAERGDDFWRWDA